jgi:hypothetical protein
MQSYNGFSGINIVGVYTHENETKKIMIQAFGYSITREMAPCLTPKTPTVKDKLSYAGTFMLYAEHTLPTIETLFDIELLGSNDDGTETKAARLVRCQVLDCDFTDNLENENKPYTMKASEQYTFIFKELIPWHLVDFYSQ